MIEAVKQFLLNNCAKSDMAFSINTLTIFSNTFYCYDNFTEILLYLK